MSRNRRRAVAIAAVGALAVAPLVSACAAGQHPQTVLPTQLVEGANASVGQIAVRNVFVLGPEPGQRLPVGGSAPLYAWIVNKGSSPDRLVAVDAPGSAQSVEVAGGGLALPPNQLVPTNLAESSSPAAGGPTSGVTPISKPAKPGKPGKKPPTPSPQTAGAPTAGAPTTGAPAGSPTAGAQSPSGQTSSSVILKGLAKELTGSETLRLTFHFQRAGAVTINVPVEPREGYYATYSPAPSSAQSAPATAPGASAPASPAANPSGSAKPAKTKKPAATPTA